MLEYMLELELCNPLVKTGKVGSKNSSSSIPSYVLMAWCLVKQRDNFTLNTLK
jgi:hypothetical protein